MRLILVLALMLSFGVLKAQEDKSAPFNKKNTNVTWKVKSPGFFSKVDSGKILILKIQNVDSTNNTVSFKILQYLNGIVQTGSEELSNCIKPRKRKKIKVHLSNFEDSERYDWTFSDITVSATETCL